MLTEEQIKQAVQESLPSVLAGLKQSLQERAMQEAREVVTLIVRDEVQKWTAEVIVPELHKTLIEHKDGIVAAGPKLGAALVDTLIEGLSADFKARMSKDWERKQILKSIIGG